MNVRTGAWLVAALAIACAAEEPAEQPAAEQPDEAAMVAQADALACEPQRDTNDRASPYDSTRFEIGGRSALVCYGRPSARGRTMIGGESVPYGSLWRTGANEPTILHIDFPARVAGIDVEPGSYSLYTIPGETEWTVILNRAIDQWGHESAYTPEIEAQEVGRGTVAASATDAHVEQFTIAAEPAGANAANLVLTWENTRVAIPVEAR